MCIVRPSYNDRLAADMAILIKPLHCQLANSHILRIPQCRQSLLSAADFMILRIDYSEVRVSYGWLGSRVVSVLDSGAKGPGSNRSRDAVG